MKRRHNDSDECLDDLHELDRLVSQELAALQRRFGRSVRRRSAHEREDESVDNVIFKRPWLKTEADGVKPKRPAVQHPEPCDTEGFQEPDTDPTSHGEQDNESFEEWRATGQPEIFGAEEQEFIAQSVRWLAARENKDLIMGRIWDLLTESAPESFYSPHEDVPPEENQSVSDSVDSSDRDSEEDS